ncbi:MAG: DUF4093 domain-containing protein [Oscillospiraceae bacterium]|nr:DUF4093 domain-containing protein [Oscillospiraceae bacterium]
MKRVKEVIVVEGRYDKNTVAGAVDATIIETSGFRIFSNKEKIALLRKLAGKCGLIILTDSDKSGFFIRGRLRGMLDGANIKHAYIPDVSGKERRKQESSREGKLGVEAMSSEVIITALMRAGATFETTAVNQCGNLITKADLFASGLSGGANSSKKRRALNKHLQLPERLTANGLLDVLNILYTRDEFFEIFQARSIQK